ncbi:ABC transporter G family member 22 [Linum perenne]
MERRFSDVSYKVVMKGMTTSTQEKNILNGITGCVNPGEVLALMGPSGSGKTTLLNLLGGRLNQTHNVGGSISYNDQPYSKFLKSRIGFVSQDDVLFAHLTVRETLTYAALLRLPSSLTREAKEKRAIDVIQELGLERCQDTIIGGSFVRGVSGGERKRVCIGTEIIINPSLLFLDEPTSGLDSTTALRIVQLLQEIAEAGKTVVTTIHQPSSRLFHKFDKLILLGKGSLLYFGKASEVMAYFSSIGCNPLLAMNPAEFLLDLANGNITDVSVPSELEDKVQIGTAETETRNEKPTPAIVHEYLVESYETRVAKREKKKLLAPIPLDEEVKMKVSCPKRQWGATWWEQYTILFCRGIKERRHDYFSWLRITQVVSTATILGLLWWQSDTSSPKGLQDQAGLLFFIAVFWGFFPVFTAIFTFPQERAVLSKERAADMYRLSAYFMARTTSDLPLDLILPVLFLLVVYFMAGLKMGPAPFFLTMVTVFLCIVAAQAEGDTILTMDRFKEPARLMIVSDLDHTMVDHHDKENMSLLRFNALWEAHYRFDSLLVFSTGRSPTLYKELRKEKPMLTPDITIMSVGTEITYGNSMMPDDGWVEVLNQKWDRSVVTEEATKFSELKLQSETEQRPHKVSFYVEKAKAQDVIKALSEIFKKRGLDVKIIYSGGMDLDILPQGAGKGQALAYLHQKFKTEGKLPKNTLVCGDSGNDAELFTIPDVHGVMVSNAQEELLQWYNENAKSNPKVIHATERCAAGIIQAIGHFSLGPNTSPRDVTKSTESDDQNTHPNHELVNFFLSFENWRRAEIENSDAYLSSFTTDSNPPGVFVHPSGAEFSLCDVRNRIKSCYGDKQGKEFRFWVDQVLSSPIGSDKWLTKFYKWEQSGEERRGCVTTCILSLKAGNPTPTFLHVHQTWLGESATSPDQSTWLF